MPEPCDFQDVHAVYGAHKSIDEYVVYLFHLATYDFARKFVTGRRVLEFGCGTGYGAHELAPECESIVGVDIEADAIEYANRTYQAPNLSYRTIGSIEKESLPFDDGAFDTVLSFQVIEHIDAVDRYIAEIRRVLAPGGTFLCSTPDRRDRLYPHQRPWNVYHVHEYEPDELATLMRRDFAEVSLYGMTAPDEVLTVELDRGHRMRRLALPLTFPGAPDWWRKPGLKALKRLRARTAKAPSGAPSSYDFDESVIRIEPNVSPSAHILTVATKR